MDPGAPRSFLLSRPSRLSPHTHRVRPHAHQRSALRSHAGLSDGSSLQTLLVDRIAIFMEDPMHPGHMRLARSMGVRLSEPMDLNFLEPARPEFARGALFFESPRAAREVPDSVRQTLEQLDLNYFVPCRIREHTVAVLGPRQNGRRRFPLQRRRRARANHRGLCRRSSGQRAALFLTRAESLGDRAPQGFQRKHRRIFKRRRVGSRSRRNGRVLEHPYGAALWREAPGCRRSSTTRSPPRRARRGNRRAPRRRTNHRNLQAAPASPG